MKKGLITAIMGMAVLLLGGPMACYLGAQEEAARHHAEIEFEETQPEAVAWLGIYMGEIGGALRHVLELKEDQGVLISQVIKYSPADKAKLAKYDIILKFNKDVVKGIDDLREKLSDKKPETEVALTVLRKHKEITVPVILGAKPPQGDECGGCMCKFMKAMHKPKKKTWLGIHTADLTPEMREELDLKNKYGVVIEKIIDGSPAAKANLQSHDVILKLDGETVKNSGDLAEKIMAREAGEEVALSVLRKGKEIDVNATLESKAFEKHSWFKNISISGHMPKFLKKMRYMRECCPKGKLGHGKCRIKIMSQFEGMDEGMEFKEHFEIEEMDDIEEMMRFFKDVIKRSKDKGQEKD